MIQRLIRESGGIWSWVRNNSIIFTFVLAQGFIFGGWMLTQELTDRQHSIDIGYLKEADQAMKIDLARIDERGSRSIPALELRLKQHEDNFDRIQRALDTISGPNKIEQLQIDGLKEQQLRIIQALDNIYNLLNEHLREDKSSLLNRPLVLPKARPKIDIPQ